MALNVTMHPHSPEAYVALFRRAKARKIAAIMFANRYCTVGSLMAQPDADGIHWGRLNTFVDFNLDAPWLDTETDDLAIAEKVKAIQLPPNLKPEYTPVDFALLPKVHKVFIRQDFGPSSFQRGLLGILNTRAVNKSDGPVNVNVVQAESGLEAILRIKHLTTLTIKIDRPNPDDLEALEARIHERLEQQRVERLTLELVGTKKLGIQPDSGTLRIAQTALQNGSVTGKGYHADGRQAVESTTERPKIAEELYDSKEEDEIEAFKRLIRKW